MTNIVDGSDSRFFYRKADVATYILHNILANKNRMLGTEWEIFFVDSNGTAISRKNGQRAFLVFEHFFSLKGYNTSLVYERGIADTTSISGLNIEGLGSITPEIGHQFEFSCAPSNSIDCLKGYNSEFFSTVCEVARSINHRPIFKGHVPHYANTTEGSYRSRSVQWHKYFRHRFGDKAISVCEALDATASTQITIDSGAEKFHEFFQALLLIEPLLTIHYSNSSRRCVGVRRLPPSHIEPVLGVWGTKNPTEALGHFVDRLIKVEVPFLPDPDFPQIYKAEPLTNGRPPTIEDLMVQGRLNELTLNNAGGFLLSRPAVRRFKPGFIEMRGVDSQPTPELIAELACRVRTLVYEDRVRENLLDDYAHFTQTDILHLHYASTLINKHEALDTIVAGKRVRCIIEDVLGRSNVPFLPFNVHNTSDGDYIERTA